MQRSAFCRSRRELSKEYLLAKFSIQPRTSSPKFAEASKRYPPPLINLALPTVERPVIAALAARRENEVVRYLITTAEAVVHVDSCAWSVEENVPQDPRLARLRLYEEGRLLFV